MIYTVTFSPALDYAMWFEGLEPGGLNRAKRTGCRAGGKGINVSLVLHRLGVPSVCLGFTAGFVGTEIVRQVEAEGLCQDFIWLEEGCSRINVKIKSPVETELNASGPAEPDEAMAALIWRIEGLKEGDVLVLSGNPPAGVLETVYADLMGSILAAGIRTVVDASGSFLKYVLPMKPFLVKPNRAELEELEGKRLESQEEVVKAAGKLREAGAVNVLVSLGAEGAVLISGEGIFACGIPEGTVVDSTGAGDSMVAAFLVKAQEGCGAADCLRYAVACGSASAYSYDLATVRELQEIYARTPEACRIVI